MNAEQLDAIQARADAATRGPWRTEPVESGRFAAVESHVYSARGIHILLSPGDGEAAQATNHDAAFIAHARTDVPALLALVREQAAQIERAENVAENFLAQNDKYADMLRRIGPDAEWGAMGMVYRLCSQQLRAALTATEGA